MVSRNWFGSALVLATVALLGLVHTLRARAFPTATGPEPLASSGSLAGGAPRFASSSTPVGPEAERLEVRRRLYESVDALVEAGEYRMARQLLDRDAEIYGEEVAPEWRDLGQSYRLIAECLEHPGAQQRARAASFVSSSRATSLISRVLSACATPREKARRQHQHQRGATG